MKKYVLQSLALCFAMAHMLPSAADSSEFSFGVITTPRDAPQEETVLRTAIEETNADNLAFVVTQGIKAGNVPCSDRIYFRQKTLLDNAKNGVIVSLAASDWARCPPESGKSSPVGRLNRLRELFFFDDFSLGASRIPVIRQSTIAKFRSFPENVRWRIGDIMFATVNLPSNNNNYLVDAGRNSEFEDRLVANRDWLNRVFTFARREKTVGIVLFCDGNPFSVARNSGNQRDGYAETRKLVANLSGKFQGKTLVVHRQSSSTPRQSAITWRGNIGELGVRAEWTKVNVSTREADLFSIGKQENQAAESPR